MRPGRGKGSSKRADHGVGDRIHVKRATGPRSRRIRPDLSALTSADAAAVQLLSDLIRQGAEIAACSSFITVLLHFEDSCRPSKAPGGQAVLWRTERPEQVPKVYSSAAGSAVFGRDGTRREETDLEPAAP